MSDVLVEAQYPYSYKDLDGVNVSFEEGDRFLLLKKANDDWWKVERTQRIDGIKNVIYVPAAYMKEIPDSVSDRSQSSTGLHLPTDKKTDSHNYVNLAELQSVLFQRSKSRSESEQSSDIGSLGTSPRVIPGRSGSSCSDLNGAVSPGVSLI